MKKTPSPRQERGSSLIFNTKNDSEDRIVVEVGDTKQPDFKPQFKFMRWDNEINFSMRAQEHPKARIREDDGVIKYLTPDYEVHQYEKPEVGEDGGFEFEWFLPTRPDSNILIATIETKGLDFFYQPPLTKKQIEDGFTQPENVAGSYAVYHKTKRDYIIGSKNYKTGKAFHIYRPIATDANGNLTYCDIKIDTNEGLLKVEVPQKWLDNATYPVTVDPTFGYTSIGLSNSSNASPTGSVFAIDYSAIVSNIYAYQATFSGTSTLYPAIYSGSAGSIGTKVFGDTIGVSNDATPTWRNMTLSVSQSLGIGSYWLMCTQYPQGTGAEFYYDAGDTNQGVITNSDDPTDGWPSILSFPSYSARKYSIYAVYTEPHQPKFALPNNGLIRPRIFAPGIAK